MPQPEKPRRTGLRFRLTLTYLIFFSVFLCVIGLLFWQNLRSVMLEETRRSLEEEWGAVKGYLRVEKGNAVWFADPTDPEEAFIVERLRHVYLLTEPDGRVVQRSDTYANLGVDSKDDIIRIMKSDTPVFQVRKTKDGVPYLIKQGILAQENHKYFLAIGRSLELQERATRQFLFNYFLAVPVVIALAAMLGWLVAGRALRPVEDVALAAERITSANLHIRIPARGSGDELDRLIQSFNQMTQRLDESFEQIRRFSVDVSHDLRTPLTALRGELEVALLTARTKEEYQSAIENALQDVERLAMLVRSLLLLAQAEAGQIVLNLTTFDPGAVAAEIAEQFEIPAEEAQVKLETSIAKGLEIEADRTQYERMLTNLLSNGIKYTPRGGTVRLDLERENDDTLIRVSDTGIGISPEHLPHIFDRFYRVKSGRTDRVQGLGLGLSFVNWIVRAHKGAIDVQSREGEGTQFTVRWPLHQEPPVPASPVPAVERIN
jgi:heavy metal sensor kinase